MEVTTLADAMAMVPQLRAHCSAVLTPSDPRGSGLKLLRLLNAQMSKSMLQSVQGYTLCLDQEAADMLDSMKLLKGCQLSCLRVIVTAITGGE